MMNPGRVIRGRVEYQVKYRVSYQVNYRVNYRILGKKVEFLLESGEIFFNGS